MQFALKIAFNVKPVIITGQFHPSVTAQTPSPVRQIVRPRRTFTIKKCIYHDFHAP